jgi:branched-chain amino acid transport system ATP-binding protein
MLLAAKDLSVSYGAVQAVRGVSIAIEAGQIIAVVGANGAGKSTLVRALSGELAPVKGNIFYKGNSILGVPSFQVARLGVVQCPEGRRIFSGLTVIENLRLGAYGRAKTEGAAAALDQVFTLFPRLAERRTQFGGTLSGGEQQMLAIGRALMSAPEVLLLDEPSLGLAPILVQTMFEAIQTINRNGTAVLLIEQNAFSALNIAHYAYVLQTGKVVLEGEGKDLLKNGDTIRAYLG